jgi:hypothetical protein
MEGYREEPMFEIIGGIRYEFLAYSKVTIK